MSPSGLDEQHRDNCGWTPLHYAAIEGHEEVCRALLEAGAKVCTIILKVENCARKMKAISILVKFVQGNNTDILFLSVAVTFLHLF
jgi:FOG: Ankyrin repeat